MLGRRAVIGAPMMSIAMWKVLRRRECVHVCARVSLFQALLFFFFFPVQERRPFDHCFAWSCHLSVSYVCVRLFSFVFACVQGSNALVFYFLSLICPFYPLSLIFCACTVFMRLGTLRARISRYSKHTCKYVSRRHLTWHPRRLFVVLQVAD